MEVDAALTLHLRHLEEHVHEHGLPAPYRAPDVEAPNRLGWTRREKPAESPGLLCRAVAFQARGERIEPVDKLFLSGIALEPAAANQTLITNWQARHEFPDGRLAPLSVRLRSRKRNAALHANVAAASEQRALEQGSFCR
jgi:hypothetical protein